MAKAYGAMGEPQGVLQLICDPQQHQREADEGQSPGNQRAATEDLSLEYWASTFLNDR